MENLIKRLPDHIANQIAAGEVIQRPASVIKELMENSIDSGATEVEVIIKDAGKSLIKVVDNGCGMSTEDARLCFERHATSKIQNADDLLSLATKGFRGEALASIAAIARVDVKTRRDGDDTSTHLCIEGSIEKSCEESTSKKGTSFEIKNLFFNVPARRNFLKSDNVEFRHIQDEFERVALSHPDVCFKLHHNDNELFNLSAGPLRKRIVDVLGRKSNDRLVPIEEETDIVRIGGFVLKPEFARKSRGEQFFFINDRFFKSSYFHHAVMKAFDGLLREKTYPGYFLYLTTPSDKIDVNVHPTKTEIKFEEEKLIYSILLSSIKQALGKYNIAPTLDFEQETSFEIPSSMRNNPAVEPEIKVNPDYNPFNASTSKTKSNYSGKSSENYSSAIRSAGFGNEQASTEDWKNFYKIEEEEEQVKQQELIEEEAFDRPNNFILKDNFILCPSKSGLMMIHAKRAIERIVYTDMMSSFITHPIDSQTLLFPVERECSKREISAWKEQASMMKQLGFDSELYEDKLSIKAIPNVWQEESIEVGLEGILELLAYGDVDKGEIAHELIASIARSAAMKKLRLQSNEEISQLIEQLFQCENHLFTPRNKKIIETLPIEAITDKFA